MSLTSRQKPGTYALTIPTKAPWAGFEPATSALTVPRSTIELPRNTCRDSTNCHPTGGQPWAETTSEYKQKHPF